MILKELFKVNTSASEIGLLGAGSLGFSRGFVSTGSLPMNSSSSL